MSHWESSGKSSDWYTPRTKTCSRCKSELPLTVEYFGRRLDRASGFRSRCKQCVSAIQRVRPPRSSGGLMRCTKCKETKPETLEHFPAKPAMRNGLHSWCRPCCAERSRENIRRRRADPVESIAVAAAKEKYRKSAKGRERKRKSSFLHNAKRRQRKLSTDWVWSAAIWAGCQRAFRGRCAYCGSKPDVLHQEHLIPLSDPACPGTVAWNMVPACEACNLEKGVRPADAYFRTPELQTFAAAYLESMKVKHAQMDLLETGRRQA